MALAREKALAKHFADLRRDRRQRSGLDADLLPADQEEAYEVARLVEGELGWGLAGWKIAALKPDMQKALRTDRPIYGRVFAPFVAENAMRLDYAAQCSPVPEVEYIAFLGADLPARARPYTFAEVEDAIVSLHPGLEIAECRFVHDASFPALPAILADGAGSGSIIYGAAIEDWREQDLLGREVTLFCNGAPRRAGLPGVALDHPVASVLWLANALAATGIGLKAGQLISTGALTGLVRARAGETYVADFGAFGSVSVTFV